MARESIVGDKSLIFGKRIAKCYRHLKDKKKETVMSKQLLRSGTSVGANVREGLYAQSRKDFVSKLNIALKEAGGPTNEASADAKLVWTMPCKEEEDEVKLTIGSI